MLRFKRLYLLAYVFVFLQTNSSAFAQSDKYPLDDWLKKLSTKNGPVTSGVDELLTAFKGKDSLQVIHIFNELEKRGDIKNNYFKARLLSTKAKWILQIWGHGTEKEVTGSAKQALDAAYETNNDSLIAEMAWTYGVMSHAFGRIGPAVMYCLFAAELDEKTGKKTSADQYRQLGTLLYRTRDYEKSIYYTQVSLARETDTSPQVKRAVVDRYNTIGICYQRMNNYDSAFFYFDIGMRMADALHDTIWKAIISGNKGQIYYWQKKYAIAKPLLEFDYNISKNVEKASAANSLQWIARINLAQGKKDSALMQIYEAMRLVKQPGDLSYFSYLQNIYYAAADVYRAIGNSDSTYRYSQLYNTLHDSIERTVADTRLEISRIRIENFQNILTIKNLEKERQAVAQQRNFIVAAIVILGSIVVLILNRQRQKLRYKQQLALREKAIAEAKMAAAEAERLAAIEQMNLFTQNLVEKSNLIEKLEQQLQTNHSSGKEELIREITKQTILTEEDWGKFKIVFEKIHPGFFAKLKKRVNDITIAEQRMAALIHLNMQPKQMSALLGISTNSVYKTKQRLRHRFNLETDWHVEEFLTSL